MFELFLKEWLRLKWREVYFEYSCTFIRPWHRETIHFLIFAPDKKGCDQYIKTNRVIIPL